MSFSPVARGETRSYWRRGRDTDSRLASSVSSGAFTKQKKMRFFICEVEDLVENRLRMLFVCDTPIARVSGLGDWIFSLLSVAQWATLSQHRHDRLVTVHASTYLVSYVCVSSRVTVRTQ